MIPAVLIETAFIIKTYVEKRRTPPQAVGEVEVWRGPFAQFLIAVRTNRFFVFHYYSHEKTPRIIDG